MKKIVSFVSAFLLLLMTLCMFSVFSETTGSITIKYTRKDTQKGISGVELSVFKVGEPSSEEYVLTEDFKSSGVNINFLTNADSKYIAAEKLYNYAIKQGISGKSSKTDSNGNAFFDNLSVGIYLAAQTKDITGYKTISPYIVFIPEQIAGGTPIYNVLSNVKTERDGGGSVIDKKFSVSVTKIWDDSNDADGIRPNSVSVTLLSNGSKLKTAVLSAENGWKHTFSNLSGNIYSYTVEETPVDGYTASYSGNPPSGFVITNKHIAVNPPKTDDTFVWVRKQWNDDNNKQGIRPKNVTIQLIKDGIVFRTALLDSSNDWNYKFDNLPDGEYTVKEISPDGYIASYTRTGSNLYTVINTLGSGTDEPPINPVNPSYTDISVKKVWNDKDNEDGLRPDSVTVSIIKDGKKYASAALSEDNGWQYIFSNLPKDSLYSVYEETNGEYSVSYSGNASDGYFITNTYPTDNPKNEPPEPTSPSYVNIPIVKIWNDSDNSNGSRPKSITVKLIKDQSIYRELELSETNGWKGVFENVPSDGSYSIIENNVQDYSAEYTHSSDKGFTVINTVVPETSDIGIPPDPFIPALQEGGKPLTSDPENPVSSSAAIPQTGNLNWPVPILAVLGIIFISAGFICFPDKRSDKK